MAEDQIRKLEGRIKELENELKQMRGARQVADVSAEEIQTYLKVRDLVAWDPDFACGINECARCIVWRCYVACIRCVRCIQVCDVECTCGPCSQGGFLGGGGRFGGLGG